MSQQSPEKDNKGGSNKPPAEIDVMQLQGLISQLFNELHNLDDKIRGFEDRLYRMEKHQK